MPPASFIVASFSHDALLSAAAGICAASETLSATAAAAAAEMA
jgi:hypothetical protein